MRLIVGLGNPGKKYQGTRHNIGFAALEKFAAKHGLIFRSKQAFLGSVAEGKIGSTPVFLLMPHTFMNESGQAVRLVADYFKIDLPSIMVVTDDIDLPVGQIRVRINSSAGTHNGLKSVEQHLNSDRYARLRIGVGDRTEGDLADHVLGPFTPGEEKLLPDVLDRVVRALEIWLEKGITSAMDFANRKPSTPSIGEV